MQKKPVFTRQPIQLRPDPTRVVVRPFRHTTEPLDPERPGETRASHILSRILALSETAVADELTDVMENFEGRHRDLTGRFEMRAAEMDPWLIAAQPFSLLRRRLIGAYFLHEYSFEASALFNPSIVPHPDQKDVPEGALRFVMSLRAIGEGHVSSLTFRSGIVARDGTVSLDEKSRLATIPAVDLLFTSVGGESVKVSFPPEDEICERVIFPVTLSQSNGIEDARFVAFDDEGRRTWYATYTAYNGRSVQSELIHTDDFVSFTLTPLSGTAAGNKGMALFPRKINGRYAMIGRQDNETIYVIYSDDLYTWNGGQPILNPEFPWEFVQIGNCGSPIELDEGWLLLTHGVGPMRKYAIGAALLDKADPSRVLARTREPLIQPEPAEREGYVPNVVYTCGAMRWNHSIILPYAVADTFTNVVTVDISDLLSAL